MKKKIVKIFCSLIFMGIIIFLLCSKISFFENIQDSFYRTLIEEDRYILLLNGLGMTFVISFFAIILGSVMGLLLCYLRRCKNKIVSKLSKYYITFIQGIPITVLLLIFYYVLFGSVNINPVIVAILTFSIYFSAYIAEVFRASLDSISTTQISSAYSLGFSKWQILRYVIFPQALSSVIPTYKNEALSLIKLTSIAGYISIMDLTKASDIIRNRTYEAFFPLIVTALIYFLVCFLLGKLLDYIYIKVNPRKAKGVNYVKD